MLAVTARLVGKPVSSAIGAVAQPSAAEALQPELLAPAADQNYIYRVNCGGPDYTDTHGNLWLADRTYSPGDAWGSVSWAVAYPNLDPRLGRRW